MSWSITPCPFFLVTSVFTPNSGPKGVINDWRRFKQLETEQREEDCREVEKLIKKLSLTCRSQLDEEKEQQKQKDLQEKISGKVMPRTLALLRSCPGVNDSGGVGCLMWPPRSCHAGEHIASCHNSDTHGHESELTHY